MAYKVQKPCKVCGKMYTPCVDCERDNSVFHWRVVACSPTCGAEYLRRIEESRKPKTQKKVKSTLSDINVTNVTNSDFEDDIFEKLNKKKNKKEREQIDLENRGI